MLSRQTLKQRQLHLVAKRCVVMNPALNMSPPYRNPAVLPFGYDFLDEDLKKCLRAKNVDTDKLERLYNIQVTEDAEMNNCRMPSSHSSKLWGFVYGQRLVEAKYRLDTLTAEERFMENYLNVQITDLTTRLKRFYPWLDYNAMVDAEKRKAPNSANYNLSYNEAVSQVIADNDAAEYVGLFQNNAFVSLFGFASDEGDKFGDFLPSSLEEQMISNFQYKWDFQSNSTDFSDYYQRIRSLEDAVSPKTDSLSKDVRLYLGEFILDSFDKNDLASVDFLIETVSKSSPSVIDESVSSMNKSEIVSDCMRLLDEQKNNQKLIGKLFFSNGNISNELTAQQLENVDQSRLVLINKSLQIFEYLKYNSMTRLLLSCLMNECQDYFAQFFANNGDGNIDAFVSSNGAALDALVSSQQSYYQSQQTASKCLNELIQEIENALASYSMKDVRGLIVSDILPLMQAPQCLLTSIFQECYQTAKEEKDIISQIKYLTFSKYIECNGGEISWYKFLNFVMNPSRNGICGGTLRNVCYSFAQSASAANDTLFGSLSLYLNKNHGVTVTAADLASSPVIASKLEELRNASVECDATRNKVEANVKSMKFVFDEIDYEYIQNNYDPLNIHLAQFRYLSPA